MPKKPFEESGLKVKRANEHIYQLDAVMAEFAKTDFHRLFVEKDPETGYDVLKYEPTKPLPWNVPLIIGDVIHNLHSALDLAVYDIVSRTGVEPSRDLYFPFRRDRDKLVSALKGREIKLLGPAIIDLILNEIKPYPGGNDALYALHDLDITDKHKLLVPILSINSVRGISAEDDRGNRLIDFTLTVPATDVSVISTAGNLKITDQGQAKVDIVFDKGQFFEDEPYFSNARAIGAVGHGHRTRPPARGQRREVMGSYCASSTPSRALDATCTMPYI